MKNMHFTLIGQSLIFQFTMTYIRIFPDICIPVHQKHTYSNIKTYNQEEKGVSMLGCLEA